MATPAQAIASLKAKMEGIVLDQVNYRMALTADRLALRIKSRIKLDLQSFFVTMVQDHFGEENEPAWSYDYSNPSWSKLSTEYVRKKKAGRIDYFVYSELPKVLSRAARKKTKTVGGFKRSNVSLRRVLSAISNPERIFGPVKVTVQSSIGINKAGKRYYLAGTTLDGVKAGEGWSRTVKISSLSWLTGRRSLKVKTLINEGWLKLQCPELAVFDRSC